MTTSIPKASDTGSCSISMSGLYFHESNFAPLIRRCSMTRIAKTRRFSNVLYAVVLIGGVASGGHVEFGARALAQNIKPEPLPLPASEFPTPSAELEALVARNDGVALRKHSWLLWSGLTTDSSQSFNGRILPIWETWLSEEEAFSSVNQLAATAATLRPRILLPFAPPRQFQHGAFALAKTLTAGTTPRQRLLAVVKMSPESVSFLAASHETPATSGQSYSYGSASDLAQLNAAFDQSNTTVKDRKIIDFPAAATDLKMVFLTVKPGGLSAIPLWNGAADSKDPTLPIPSSWKTCVAVDPTNSRTGTASVNCNGDQVQAEIVPLNAFYSVQISPAEAATINSLSKLEGAARVHAGDYHVLVAMHVTTKEIANWTWATFWWQNGKNPPNDFPGSVADMPDASKVKGPWRNYATCTGDSMVVPATDPKGKPVVCFNPYLETGQTDGLNSNCMSCHAMARQPLGRNPDPYPQTYLPNGFVDLADPNIFGGATKTDFVWAIPQSAH
jgi:hypothetical protein